MTTPTIIELESDLTKLEQLILELDLQLDLQIDKQVSRIKIELEGMNFNNPSINDETKAQLHKLHVRSVETQMQATLENALAYYALPYQVEGTNEASIGPVLAQQLRIRLRGDHLNLEMLKDDIYNYLQKIIT